MQDKPEGCASPSIGPIDSNKSTTTPTNVTLENAVRMDNARVGKPAPDFELTAFIGEGFKNLRLSDYKGKWIVLCFYPGDFTYV